MEEIYELIEVDNFKVKCIKSETVITPYLKTGKLWGSNMEIFIKELYEPNTNMIDIGAHIGTISLIMSKYISEGNKIYSFEPVYYDLFEENIKNNNLQDKTEIYKIGLSNIKTCYPSFTLDLKQSVGYGAISFKSLPLKFDATLNEGIHFQTLDSFGFTNVSLIKIDVELFEKEVLEGGTEFLHKNKPTIIIELFIMTPLLKRRYSNGEDADYTEKERENITSTTFSCFSLLSYLGYVCFPIIPNEGEFLFIHKSKTELINKTNKLLNKFN